VGGNDEIGTIRPDDVALVLWRADAPLRLSIESSEIDRNPEALNLDEDLRDQLDSHLQAAEIIVEIGNHFPFDLSVEFLVGPDSLTTLNDPELTIGPLTVASGLVGETSRYVEEAVTTRHVITLTGTQIRAFTRENAYTGLRALIPGTNGAEVLLRTGDGLSALGALSVEILIEDD
jgi:acyl carrier protein